MIILPGAEKLKLGEDLDDLHLYLNDGTEICSDEDFIPELIVGNLLFLRKSTSTSPASLPPKQIRKCFFPNLYIANGIFGIRAGSVLL